MTNGGSGDFAFFRCCAAEKANVRSFQDGFSAFENDCAARFCGRDNGAVLQCAGIVDAPISIVFRKALSARIDGKHSLSIRL